METICGQGGHCGLTSFACFLYDFQTLIAGAAAILLGVAAAVPVWRQLKDSNLQTRISHRETLATLLRDALTRFDKVARSFDDPLSTASRITSDPMGEPVRISAEDAHGLEQMLSGVLDWYLVVLADTEDDVIEDRKTELQAAIVRLTDTLNDAHWADHNEQVDEDRDTPDHEWAAIVARCAEAKDEASTRVGDVEAAYQRLRMAQDAWAQSIRLRIAKLDSQIASG